MSWDILPKGNLQYFLQKLKGKLGTPTELTTAQYNALPTSDKNDASKVYYLTDYPSGGGSGGGSGLKAEVIYQNEATTNPATIILNNAYTDYDVIVIRCFRAADNTTQTIDHFFLTKELSGRIALFGWATSSNYVVYGITSNTELTLSNQGANYLLHKIYGIKFG